MSKLNFPFSKPVDFLLFCFSLCCVVIGLVFAAQIQYAGHAIRESKDGQIDAKRTVDSERGKQSSIAISSPTPAIPHTLVGSYYTLENNIDAKLLLNNKGNTRLEVRPTLYNSEGQELQIAPVYVEPQSYRFINLQDWVAIGGESFRSGNIKLFHYGKDLVLGAQIYLTDETHSLSFEEKLSELSKFNSQRQEAVWWMPSNQADVKVVLTNTGDTPLAVTGTLANKPNHLSKPQTITVAPHSTNAFDLRDEFPGSNSFLNSDVVALSLEHTGAPDALLSRVMVYEETRGYSNVVQFSNPGGGKSSEYQGVGFQIEDISDQQFNPVIVVRNVGNEETTVTAKVPYTRANGTRGNITLPPEQLSPGEMRSLNTQKIIQRVARESIKVASLEVEYTSAPGSVIVAAHSNSEDHNQVFRVPMWDPLGQRSPTGGYPWRIEGTSKTETYIKNITDEEEDYVAFLVWENGGMYMIGLKQIRPHETINIDVKKLRNEQIPDERGRTIPQYISNGQLQWTLRRKDNLPDDDARANLSLIGRSEQVDTANGIVNNYSCQNCCPGTHAYGFITPASAEIEYGETAHFLSVEAEETCYGFPYEFNIGASWSSSDTGIGTISGGDITGIGVGQTDIGASWSTHSAFSDPCPPVGTPVAFEQVALVQNLNGTCKNDGDRRGGPNVSETENKNTSFPVPLRPACGTCQFHSFIFYPPVATLLVKPNVTINVPTSANDGSAVTFTSTVNGNWTVTGYQWSFTTPTGAGNSPDLSFTAATSGNTGANAKWFASPNDACTASTDSIYTVELTVSFSGHNPITKRKSFTVQVPWNPGGVTSGGWSTSGSTVHAQNGSGQWYVSSIGTYNITTSATVAYSIPTASQFRSKTETHEGVHVAQWQPSGLLGSYYTNAGLWSSIQNVTASTEQGLVAAIEAATVSYGRSRDTAAKNGSCDQAEIDAYAVSDSVAPQYLYQRCNRTTFTNCH